MKSNTKRKQQKQQKVSKKREFLRKIIESSVILKEISNIQNGRLSSQHRKKKNETIFFGV
jgi:hypothetical protein